MSNLRNIESDTLQAVKDVAGTYQTYQENFNDEKYREINVKKHKGKKIKLPVDRVCFFC